MHARSTRQLRSSYQRNNSSGQPLIPLLAPRCALCASRPSHQSPRPHAPSQLPCQCNAFSPMRLTHSRIPPAHTPLPEFRQPPTSPPYTRDRLRTHQNPPHLRRLPQGPRLPRSPPWSAPRLRNQAECFTFLNNPWKLRKFSLNSPCNDILFHLSTANNINMNDMLNELTSRTCRKFSFTIKNNVFKMLQIVFRTQ